MLPNVSAKMVTGVFPALPGRQLEPLSTTNKKCRMKSRKASKNVFLSFRSQLGSSRGKKTRRWSRSRSTTTFHHRKYRLNVFFAPIPAFRNRNRFASWRGGGSPNGWLRFRYCSLQWANRQMVFSNGRFHSRFHYKNYSLRSALEVSKYGRSIVGLAKATVKDIWKREACSIVWSDIIELHKISSQASPMCLVQTEQQSKLKLDNNRRKLTYRYFSWAIPSLRNFLQYVYSRYIYLRDTSRWSELNSTK